MVFFLLVYILHTFLAILRDHREKNSDLEWHIGFQIFWDRTKPNCRCFGNLGLRRLSHSSSYSQALSSFSLNRFIRFKKKSGRYTSLHPTGITENNIPVLPLYLPCLCLK